jgi:hypothetical protein
VIGLALALGWEPAAVRALTLPELEVVSDHLRSMRRAQARARARSAMGR